MQNTRFLKNKIARQITLNGQQFSFERYATDKYHQQSSDVEEVTLVFGIFHETVAYVRESGSDSGRMVSKSQPMILLLCDDESKKIQHNDIVRIGDCTYHVVSKKDVKNLGVAYDISLEVIV